jgi:hypothetical protein
LNKMREKEETIQAVVDSSMATDGEATVYTSARFRYLLQVLPMVITVSFVLRTWRPHIHRRLSRRCGYVYLCEKCEFTLIVCRGNRPSCRGIISTTRNWSISVSGENQHTHTYSSFQWIVCTLSTWCLVLHALALHAVAQRHWKLFQ